MPEIPAYHDDLMPERLCILTDGDDTTWAGSAVLVECSEEIKEQVVVDSRLCRDIVDERPLLSQGQYKVYDASEMLDALKHIADLVERLDAETARDPSIARIRSILAQVGMNMEG